MVTHTRYPQNTVEALAVYGKKNIPVSIKRKKVKTMDASAAVCYE